MAGCSQFDMGRSEAGSSNLSFKANWGTKEIVLHYNYLLLRLKEIPYLDPRNPKLKYRVAIAAWKALPLFLTKRLGPMLMPGLA
jgi:hypothetical protein